MFWAPWGDPGIRDEPGSAESPYSDGEDQAFPVKLGIMTEVLADSCGHIIESSPKL